MFYTFIEQIMSETFNDFENQYNFMWLEGKNQKVFRHFVLYFEKLTY